MALTIDATATASVNTAGATSLSSTNLTVGAGATSLLVALIIQEQSIFVDMTAASVNWDTAGTNQALTLITSIQSTNTNLVIGLFGLVNPTAGAKTLTATWTNSAPAAMDSMSFSGGVTTSATTAFVRPGTNLATTGAESLTLTGASGNISVCVAASVPAAITSLTTTGSNNWFTDTTEPSLFVRASTAPSTTSVTWTGAPTSTEWCIAGLDVVAAPVESSGNPPRQAPGRGPRPLIPQPWRNRDFTSPPHVEPVVARAPFRRLPGKGPRPLVPQPWAADFTATPPASPNAGSLVFTGFAPSADEDVKPGVGSVTLTGLAPNPDVGGYPALPPRQLGRGPRPLIPRPARDINVIASPLAGSITFTGFAPSADEDVKPGVGSVVFTGLAPSADEDVKPGAGSVVFTGLAPSANEDVKPGSGSVVFTGLAPSADATAAPDAGSVLFTGFAPTVTGVGTDIAAFSDVGSLIFTGLPPTISGAVDATVVGGGDDEDYAAASRKRWLEWNRQRWLKKQRDIAAQKSAREKPEEPARKSSQQSPQRIDTPQRIGQPFVLPLPEPPAAQPPDDTELLNATAQLAAVTAQLRAEEDDIAALLLMWP